ncbi:unnamed protein product [Choristocarpus tenellus]
MESSPDVARIKRGKDVGDPRKAHALRQLGAMLRKNALLKLGDWAQTLAEVTIPALFMLLLVWIKSITTTYDSPNVAYTCGQTRPWMYQEQLDFSDLFSNPLVECLLKPPDCETDSYYRGDNIMSAETGVEGLYPTVGYVDSGMNYPWYGITVGDQARFYDEFRQYGGLSNTPDSWT